MTASGAVPWWPESMPEAAGTSAGARRRWAYVSVEEIVDAAAELVRWPWPMADRDGRLSWADDVERRVQVAVVPVAVLHRFMYRPSGLARAPRCGDVFAAETQGSRWDSGQDDAPPEVLLRRLFPGMVVDVSAAAREGAKVAYHAATAAMYDAAEAPDRLTEARAARARPAPTLTIVSATDDPGARP